MSRLVFILRHRLPVIIFIIITVIGGVFIFWYINNRERGNRGEITEIQKNISDTVDETMETIGVQASSSYYGHPFSSSIPSGFRAVNLPISFFGDIAAVVEGDKVDIISVFYDPGLNELYSEVILRQKKIIAFQSNDNTSDLGNYQGASSSGYFSGGVFNDFSSGNINNSQLKKILVLTFYLEVFEVEIAFGAIESGQLYLSICPEDS
jgi:hypothetical protein